jgi:hypothetical protein
LGILSLFRKKDNTAFEFSAAAAQQDLANPNASGPAQEYVDTVGKIGYLLNSPTMEQFFMTNKYMQVFIPAFQSVNRTTKLSNHEAEIMWLDFQIAFTMAKLTMPPDVYEQGAMAMFQSLEILAGTQITDGKEGWKGHLITEQVRRIDVQLNKKDKFGGR